MLELTRDHVKLRIGAGQMLTPEIRRTLRNALSAFLGTDFRVEFEIGETTSETVLDREREEKARIHAALVERFMKQPAVKNILETFEGEIDESSLVDLSAPAKKN